MAFSFIALSSLNNAFTKPSPLNAAILQIRLIPLIEASVIATNTWLIPNFVALCHSVGKDELMDLTMCWWFIYFATVLRPEYFVMLLPEYCDERMQTQACLSFAERRRNINLLK